MVQRDVWDVTYILPKGNKAVYRQVPLRGVDDLLDLTREVAITSIKSQQNHMLHLSAGDDKACVIPGFDVHHLPPKDLMHLGPMLITPDAKTWHSLLQRQADTQQITLQITRQRGQGEKKDSPPDMARGPPSTPSLVENIETSHPSVPPVGNAVAPREEDKDGAALLVKEPQVPVEADVTRVSSPFVERKSASPKPPAVLTRLREHIGVRPHSRRMSPLFPQDSHTLESSATPTVRVFALTYVLKCLRNLSRGRHAAQETVDEFSFTFISRLDMVYFAAATVKIWQSKLLISPAAMDEKWIHLPPLLRDAQCNYLKDLVGELWSRLCDAAQLEKRGHQHTKGGFSSSLVKEKPREAVPLYEGKNVGETGADEALVLIEEVTYGSLTRPLPLRTDHVTNSTPLISLRVPKYVDVHEEIVIVGCIHSKKSIGLCWWLVEHRPCVHIPGMAPAEGEQSSIVLSLDALYQQRRIATFQITPHTFLLIIKPGSLLPSRWYRCVVEAYEIRTGNTTVSEANFETFSKGRSQ